MTAAKVLGVITDRDIALRAVETGRTPSAVTVREVMTTNVVSIHENDKVDIALDLMQRGSRGGWRCCDGSHATR